MESPLTAEPLPIVAITRRLPGELTLPGAELRVGPERAMPRAELLDFVAGASALITWVSENIDAQLLDAAAGLRVVANYAVGVDNIDLDACTARGVTVTNTPDAVTEGTANMALALLLAVARRVVEGDRFVRAGDWARAGLLGPADMLGQDLTGRTMLIVGAGRIGQAMALRAHALGMRILYVSRTTRWRFELAPLAARHVELDEGLALCDVLSIHTPLTPQTHHLINAESLALLKPSSILINTSRGGVVDESALVAALGEGRLAGAGLDVFEHEPHVHQGLLTLENVVLTPHIGSAERRFRQAMTRMALENVRAVLQGEAPPNPVT